MADTKEPEVKTSEEGDFEKGGGMRADVDQLLVKHADTIKAIRKALGADMPVGDPQYDDVFLLRYVLSHKADVEKCADYVRQTVKWRVDNKDKLADAMRTGFGPHHETAIKFNAVGYAGHMPDGEEPIYVVRTGYCDLPGLMSTLTMEQVTDWLHFTKEVSWQHCDKITRKSRKITKLITVIDMDGFSLFGGDSRFYKCLGQSSKWAAVYYPQLLGKTVMINTPTFFRVIYRTFSVFMPQSALDKNTLCPAKNTATEDISKCPFMRRYNAVAAVPAFLGGTLECPKALIPRAERADKMETLTVKNRDSSTVRVAVPASSGGATSRTVCWEVLVKEYGIGFSADFVATGAAERKEMVAARKIKAVGGLGAGSFEIEAALGAGELVLTFDNSYSILRSKQLKYRVDVMESASPEAEQVKLLKENGAFASLDGQAKLANAMPKVAAVSAFQKAHSGGDATPPVPPAGA